MLTNSKFLPLCAMAILTASAIAATPIATADPALPGPGAANARDTLTAYTMAGYTTQINWVSGVPDVGLSQCWVNNINTSGGGSGVKSATFDIECPK